MTAKDRELAEQALMKVQDLELVLFQMEQRNPITITDLAAVGHHCLAALRKIVGTPEYWSNQVDPAARKDL